MLFVRDDPQAIYRNLPDVIRLSGVTAEQIEREGKAEAERARTAFERWCANAGLRSDGQYTDLQTPFGVWGEQIGEIEPVVAFAGRVSDLVVVNRPTSADLVSERVFDAAVFSTGRPALVVGERVPEDLLRHVVIAWNGSLEAARLIGHANDLLRAADRVSIVTAPSERSSETAAADLQDYLVWHGIRARQLATVTHAASTGEALLQTAERAEATMLVLGAYTHSRIRQMLLGGVTHHVLHNAKLPVLMEH
jgi:nucleotide-binding universal stress UspA family protein